MLKERDHEQYPAEMLYEGSGGGGGDEPHTPVEKPNNLLSVAYAKVLIAVAEGELAGTPTGKDIYLGGTPLISENGDSNFGGVTWEWRNGSQSQSYIQGMPEVSNEVAVGVEIKQTTPWTRLITKKTLSAYRITLQWPALMRQKQNGDTVGYKIEYAVDLSVDGGPFTLYQQYTVEGKTNTAYERTHRIDLPQGVGTGWSIRVRRITPEDSSSLIQDTMNLKSYAEVIDAKQRYPNTALLFVSFDSRLFGGGSIPTISVRTKGRLIRVPDNYDPETRTYSGIWSGVFKWAYTNNPAWVFFDLCTQDRFGLGKRISTSQVDKWELYEIAKYCDVMVDDGTGAGTTQPRHTCNIYIQTLADAYKVLRDICSIFNGMSYWDGSQFIAIADKPEDISNTPLFSRSNVVNGDFNYQTTDERSIYTSALVSYDEPDDHFGTQVEAVWERSEILRWGGDRQTSLSAIGCTSRGEAQRKGKYTLLTNMLNRTVAFKTGLEGLSARVRPGSIIGVADPLISGKAFTGRLVAAVPTVVTLDRDTEAKAGDVLFITMKDGIQQGRTIEAVAGRVVTVTTAYTQEIMANAIWYLEASDMKSQLFKVIRLAPGDDGTFEINAVEYNESKFAAIDNGARLEPRPISKVPPSVQQSPKPILLTAQTYVEQTMAITTLTISWPKTENAILYEGEWKVGEGDWVTLGTTGAQEFNVKGVYTGDYVARVRAINALDIKSVWSLSDTTAIVGKVGMPPALAGFSVSPLVYGMRLDWLFPEGAEDTARTEIMYSTTTSFADAIKLGDFAYPQDTHDINGLAAGTTFFFWARLADRTGNIGDFFPLTTQIGIVGSSSTNVADYEEYFKDQINESALGQHLADRIDKIEVLEVEVADITEDITAIQADTLLLNNAVNWMESQLGGIENQLQNDIGNVSSILQGAIDVTNEDLGDLKDDVNDLNNEVASLQDQVENFVDALLYDPSLTYQKGEAVREGHKLYQAIKDVPYNTAPPNTEYWKDVGDIVTELGAVSAQVSTNTNTITQQGNSLVAQGQMLNALDVRVDNVEAGVAGNTSAITSLSATVTQQGNDITSQGQAITALESGVESLTTGQAGNATAIESLRTTVVSQGDLITSQGQSITSLSGEVSALQTDVNGVQSDVEAQGTAITGLTTTVTQQGNTISSHSNSITSLEGAVSTLTTDVSGLETQVDANTSAVANLQNTVTQQGNTITAQGSDITTLKADVATIETDVDGLTTTVSGQGTAISLLQTTVVQQGEDIAANSSDIIKLTADVQFSLLDSLYDNAETDQQITEALNIASGAATATSSLTAEVSKQGDVITAQGQSITELNASLSDVNGDIVGIGSAINSLNTITTSQGNTIVSQGNAITSLGNSLTVVSGKADDALAQVSTKAEASAVTALTTRVSSAEGTISSQGTLITQLNNSLTITDGKVSDAQDAADEALSLLTTKADSSALQSLSNTVTAQGNTITAQGQSITSLTSSLAITDGKATDALTQVATKADASALSSLTTRVTDVEGEVATQGQAITTLNTSITRVEGKADNALTQVSTKADASALNSLTTRVSTAEGTISSQGTAITSLNNSLTVTNTNVTAAQSAATAANTLAGSKGEVIYGATAPTVAQRLPQNLWIDTTGNANTPKRWDGSTWAPVTDKVATDAATAAANALTQVSTKAESSAVTTLANRVTATETTITSQGQSITQLNNSLTVVSGKADDALEQITHKADSSVVDSLSSTVTSQGNTITAQATAITGLTTKVNDNTASILQVSDATTTLTSSVANMASSVQAIASGLRDDDGSGELSSALEAWNSGAKYSSDIKAVADENQATITKTEVIEASLNDTNASVEVLSKAQAGASASWSVKLQVNSQGQYVAAGIGLGIENGPAGLQSSFLVSADKFAVVNGVDENLSTPFVVSGGQVFIKDAFIANGSITMLKIGDALQSDDYIAGQKGWKLSKGGNIEFNGTVAGGGRLTMSNQLIQVYDNNDVLRVRMGIW